MHGVDRQLVGADLVRHIAVGSNAISPDDDPGDALGFHQVSGSRIGIESDRHPIASQFPGSQPRALQPGAGFIDIDLLDQTIQIRRANHPERRAKATGRQRTGIAVSQQHLRVALMLANQLHAQLRHGQVGLTVAEMNPHRLGLQQSQDVVAILKSRQALTHALQGPEQVYRGRTRALETGKIRLQRLAPVTTSLQPSSDAQHQAIGSSDADNRRAAHHHIANRVSHLGGRIEAQPGLPMRQQALIEQVQRTIAPLDCLNLLHRQQLLAHRALHLSPPKNRGLYADRPRPAEQSSTPSRLQARCVHLYTGDLPRIDQARRTIPHARSPSRPAAPAHLAGAR